MDRLSAVPGARHYVRPEPTRLEDPLPLPEEPARERRPLRRVVMGSALALGALTAAGVGATYAASHAPICQEPAAHVALTDQGLCVSPEIGVKGAHGWRILSGLPHALGAVESLESSHNQVSRPDGSIAPAPLMESGSLKVVTFNTHHERSRDSDGAREQTGDVVQALREQRADVYLLQEVSPGHVDDLVNGTGMVGYYSQTTILQGNLLLVHPALEVTADSQRIINNAGNGLESLKDWALEGGSAEPRSVQTVTVKLPDGREALLWNTHQPTHNYTAEQRAEAREATTDEIDEQEKPGQIVIGGGDLNAGANGSLASSLRADGHEVHAYNIDFINVKNADGPVEFQGFHLNDSEGYHLSDHPMAVARVPI